MEDNKRYKVVVEQNQEWTESTCRTYFKYHVYDNLQSKKILLPTGWEPYSYCRYLNRILDDRDLYLKEILAYAD